LETAAAADPPEQSLETPLDAGSAAGEEPPTNAGPLITDRSYTDENIRITIDTYRRQDTTIYLADIVVSGVEYLKTALAKDRYGRNIRDTTSAMAAEHGAILAINGDYYGVRDAGCVLRNGTLYRDAGNGEALVMDWQGDLRCVSEASLTQADIESAWQIWSFGPVLIKDGQIAVGAGTEIQGRSAPSNPRTAIGQAGPLHYVMIVSDGRTRTDRGLSLLELAEEFALRGCTIAYNLDGGGSSSMVFNGQVLNRPTTNGRTIDEREVSDIVYAGYR
jgi:exopolysaccharide biosynthesis protein